MTQCETVMKHMRERGGITTKEAYERYGEKVRVARYRLK